MKQKVYLAGGFNSDWRKRVTELDNVEFYIPKSQPNKTWQEYFTWDIHYVKQCDIVFGYMEKTNPSGFGLSVELGYALGIGKTVILVLEEGHEKDKYLQFLKGTASVVFNDLLEGIEFLKTF